jgi:uncharacterized cupin superfamily protein
MPLSGIRNANLCIYQGDDFACWITVLNRNDGAPADLTDFTALAQIRTGPADEHPYAPAANMVTTICAPSNISLWIPRELTRELREFEYVWDLELTSSGGQITTILQGDVLVMPEVTRADWRGHMWDAVIASQPLWRPVQLFRTPSGINFPHGRNDPWG